MRDDTTRASLALQDHADGFPGVRVLVRVAYPQRQHVLEPVGRIPLLVVPSSGRPSVTVHAVEFERDPHVGQVHVGAHPSATEDSSSVSLDTAGHRRGDAATDTLLESRGGARVTLQVLLQRALQPTAPGTPGMAVEHAPHPGDHEPPLERAFIHECAEHFLAGPGGCAFHEQPLQAEDLDPFDDRRLLRIANVGPGLPDTHQRPVSTSYDDIDRSALPAVLVDTQQAKRSSAAQECAWSGRVDCSHPLAALGARRAGKRVDARMEAGDATAATRPVQRRVRHPDAPRVRSGEDAVPALGKPFQPPHRLSRSQDL